jgi:hypothetical protein
MIFRIAIDGDPEWNIVITSSTWKVETGVEVLNFQLRNVSLAVEAIGDRFPV